MNYLNKNNPYLSAELNFKKISSKKRKKALNSDKSNDVNIKTDNRSDYNKNNNNNNLKVQRKNVLKKNKNMKNRANTDIKTINSDNKNSKILQNQNNNYTKILAKKYIFK